MESTLPGAYARKGTRSSYRHGTDRNSTEIRASNPMPNSVGGSNGAARENEWWRRAQDP